MGVTSPKCLVGQPGLFASSKFDHQPPGVESGATSSANLLAAINGPLDNADVGEPETSQAIAEAIEGHLASISGEMDRIRAKVATLAGQPDELPRHEAIPRLLVTVSEAAETLGLSRSTVYSLMDSGQLESRKIGASRRIPVAALEDYVNRRTEQSCTQ